MAKPNISIIQSEINERMRAMLIDWLVEVHLKFQFSQDTLYLTINIIDRLLELENIKKDDFQLVGVAALLISSKYEEIYPPNIVHLLYISNNSFNKDDLIKMEGKILNLLNFKLKFTSALNFLKRFSILAKLDNKNFFLANYFIELYLLEYKMINYKPSLIACAAIYLVNKMRKKDIPFCNVLSKNSHYCENDLKCCARDICFILKNIDNTSFKAVKNKFSLKKFMEVSKIKIIN